MKPFPFFINTVITYLFILFVLASPQSVSPILSPQKKQNFPTNVSQSGTLWLRMVK